MQSAMARPQSPGLSSMPRRVIIGIGSTVVAALLLGFGIGYEIGAKSTAAATVALPAVPAASGSVPQAAPVDSAPSPAPVADKPSTATITLAVHSVKGDFGGYIVNLHDGNVAKQTTFNVDRQGKWSKTITVPVDAMVKLDIARIGATCEITDASGATLIRGENSCIVGS